MRAFYVYFVVGNLPDYFTSLKKSEFNLTNAPQLMCSDNNSIRQSIG